tara:strand:+ start:211 stop:474 length:264 start_codon:yes stop_codon:yes gene_type:complete
MKKLEKEILQDLAAWSENFDSNSPFNLFLDLIGYSQSEYGVYITENHDNFMGYKEYVMLANALQLFEKNGYETIYNAIAEILEETQN